MDRPERAVAAPGIGEASSSSLLTLQEWIDRGCPAGQRLQVAATDALEEHYGALATQAEIRVELPAFVDGRAFSHGRKLRQHGYDGPLLACGEVLADQWEFLRRCGYTALAGDAAGGSPGFAGYTVAYQHY